MNQPLAGHTVAGFLDAVAARTPAPGAGGVAAFTVAAAAGLTAMAARFTTGEPAELVEPAEELRRSTIPLADADAQAYAGVLAALRLPRSQSDRQERVTAAVRAAAEVPMRIARAGAQVAGLAARLVLEGNRNLAGDALTAVLLADAATRAAAGLVRINTELGELERHWLTEADGCVRTAADAREAMTRWMS